MNVQQEQQALIHLAWCRAAGVRHLIFGWVEILPACFPPMRGHPFRSPKTKQAELALFVARFPMSAVAAESWFEAAARGELRLPAHPDKKTAGDGEALHAPLSRREPENGSQSSARDLPFLPSLHGVMLAHGLLPTEDHPRAAELADKSNAQWLRENMFIDFAEHPEYLGSLVMARHPPVVRDVESRLGRKGAREVELVRIRRWPGTHLAGHKMLALEQRTLGFSVPRELEIDQSLIELDWNGRSDRTAVAVTHSVHGLSWWREPAGFLRSIQIGVNVVHGTRRIVRSVDADGKVLRHYDTPWLGSNEPIMSVVGEEADQDSPSNRAWRAEANRRRLTVAASLGLRWFDDPESAQAAVREIIGKARREFTVIDPYFGPEQIRDFAMAVTAGDVAIRIVTSEECLGREAEGGQEPVSVALERALSEFSAHGWSRPEVLVMKGRRAPLHDRFLVADGRVWLSGNSFHAIGARASVLIELPNPQEVLGHLRPYMERAEAFSTWFTHRVAPGARNEQPDGNSPPAREDDL